MRGDGQSTTSPAFAWSVWRDVVLSVWSRGGSEDDIREFLEAIDATAHAHGGQAGVVMVITERTSLPSAGGRRLAASYLQASHGRISYMVIVVEGQGFWASAMRSVFSGLGLLARPKEPWSMVATVEEALSWQARFLEDASDAEAPQHAMIEQLRSSLATSAPHA